MASMSIRFCDYLHKDWLISYNIVYKNQSCLSNDLVLPFSGYFLLSNLEVSKLGI